MSTGKIVSIVGDQVVVESTACDAHQLKKTAYTAKGALGRVVDVIGRTSKPYLVLKRMKNVKCALGEVVQIK